MSSFNISPYLSELTGIKRDIKSRGGSQHARSLVDGINLSLKGVLEKHIEQLSMHSFGALGQLEHSAINARPSFLRRLERKLRRNRRGLDPKDWKSLDDPLSSQRLQLEIVALQERAKFLRHARFDQASEPDMRARSVERAANGRILIICRNYPDDQGGYGGAFIKVRVEAYAAEGRHCTVFVCDEAREAVSRSVVNGVPIRRGSSRLLRQWLAGERFEGVAVHSPTASMMSALQDGCGLTGVAIFLHGFEARDYLRLMQNHSADRLRAEAHITEPVHLVRMALLAKIFKMTDCPVVFVSNFLRQIAEVDIGAIAPNAHIIPNHVSARQFPYVEKTNDKRHSVLSIRPFTRANYGGDLIVETIKVLSERPGFEAFNFHVHGFGAHFERLTAPLRSLRNVHLVAGAVEHVHIPQLHAKSGIYLCPSRHDTQGLGLCEAMSSGLVPVSNAIGGIPEFAPPEAALLGETFDPRAYADNIEKLVSSPAKFQTMSAQAAQVARARCGASATSMRELDVLLG